MFSSAARHAMSLMHVHGEAMPALANQGAAVIEELAGRLPAVETVGA